MALINHHSPKTAFVFNRNIDTGYRNSVTPIAVVFNLANGSHEKLIINSLHPSCGCTSAIIGSNAHLPFTVAPGEPIPIQVTIDTFHLTPGKIDKTVAVYAKGYDKPFAILEVTGTILSTVRFSKPAVDFNDIGEGDSKSATVDVFYDKTLVTQDAHVEVKTTYAGLTVEPLGPAVAADAKTPILGTSAVPEYRRTYTVRLSPGARIGNLMGKIEAVLRTGNDASKDVVLGELPVRARIDGEVTAMPETIAFGSVARRHEGTQQVVLTGSGLDSLTVVSDNPHVIAAFASKAIDSGKMERPFGSAELPAPGVSAGGVHKQIRVLQLTLSADTPSGAVSSAITVTTAHHQVLALPVYGFVEEAK